MSEVTQRFEDIIIKHHPSTVGVTVIFMSIHDPRTYFLERSLSSNFFDGSIYELSIGERGLWGHILRSRSFNGRWRFNIALFPLLRIVLA